MNKNNKTKPQDKKKTFFSEILSIIIQSTLHFQKQLILNSSVQIIILLVCNFQTLSFVIYQDYGWQETSHISIYSFILMAVFRTDILIAKYEITFQFIIYLLLLVILGLKLLIILNHERKYQIMRQSIQYYMDLLFSIYIQLFFNLLLIPFTTLVSLSIIYQYQKLKNNNQNYVQVIFGIIIFIIVQLEALIHLIINQQSIDTKIVCFEKIKVTVKDFIIYLLNMTSVIVFSMGETQNLQWIMHIILFLSSYLTIYNQLETQGIIHPIKKNIVYFCHSFTLCYLFFSSISLFNSFVSINHLFFTFLAFPIILHIVKSVDSEINNQLFYKSFDKGSVNMKAISYLLIIYQNNVKLPKMLKIYIFNQHKCKCRDSKCFCHHDKLLEDSYDTAPLTRNIFQDFALGKLKLCRKSLFNHDKAFLDELIYHSQIYGALLANYGWIIQSVKHFNQLLFGRQQHYKNSSQSVNQSIMAPSSFSATIRNDQSSQSLTDPEKKYAEVSFQNLQRQQKHAITYQIKLNFTQTQKILFLVDSIKFKLKNTFGGQQLTSEQHELSEHIQNFMQQEFKMEQYLIEITKILKLKIKYFESSMQLLKKKSLSESQKQIQQICKTLIAFQQKLHLDYELYPSKRLQSLQVFYEAEVFKNYLNAYKLVNRATMSENQLFILNQNFSVNFYTNKVSFLLCTVDDNLQHIEILQQSSNFKKMVDYKINEEFDFQSLLLQFIAREHPILVSRFFKSGKSKFYKQFSQTFIKNKKGIAKPIIFSFDNISQLKNDKISVVGIYQEVQMEFSFVMVDVNNILGGMTKSFLNMLGFTHELIERINDFSLFYKLKISQIFPKFEELTENELMLIRANNIDTYFIDLDIYLSILLSENADTFQKQESLSHQIWGNQKLLKKYQSNVTIHKKELYGYYYYVIEVNSIIQNQTLQTNTEQQTQLQVLEITEQSENFELSQLNLSIGEAMPKTINLFTIKSREGYSQNTNRNVSIEKNINLFEVKEIYQDDLLDKIDQFQIQQIVSPNKSTSQLIENQQNKFLQSQQQDYFTDNKSQKQIKVGLNAEQKSQNLREDLHKENETKKVTEYGYHDSLLFNKFVIINEITKDKQPKMLNYLLSVIYIIIAIQIVCPLLIVFILNQDILQFISNIEMISFHASIQGPHDLFFLMRNTISAYQQMQREGFLKQSQIFNLTEPYYQHIGLGYIELKDSLYKQLNNQYLEHFLDDEQMTLMYMKNDQSSMYPVGPEKFRECLLQILQYQYDQMRTFQKRGSTSGQAYQIFLFANYFNFQDKLEAITSSILAYTLNQSAFVSQKWITIWILFSILLLTVLIIQGFTYHHYLKSYDEFLKLLSFIDKTSAQLEIEKLQQLLTVLKSNQEYSYSYQFDISHQEQIMIKYIELNKIQKTKKIDLDQSQELTRKNNIIFWIMIALIFFTYALIVEMKNEDYLSKFDETTNFYVLIQNLKFRSGCLFLYRETLLKWANFTYLTSHDKDRAYLLIDKAQKSIQDYLTFTSTFEPNLYLISDGFATFFQEQQTNNLCDQLDKEYFNWVEKYCKKAFEGQIQNGAIPVLNYISNSIRSQQAVNNFTKRAEVQLYELEGAQIILKAFFNTSSQFQNGLSDITLKENNFVLIITIIFLIYLSFFLLIVGCYLKPSLNQEYALLRRIVFLIPSQILLGDDTFERCLKQIALNQGLK